MEEAVVKQGGIHLQLQQTFGKQKWKRCWAVLYRDSPRSSARLELQEGAERSRRAEGGRRLVLLRDCVRVAEGGGDGPCPKDTVPFLLETTERRWLLAAEPTEAAEWVRRLCELAFGRGREEPGAAPEVPAGGEGELSMEENSLYSSRGSGLEQTFEVTVRVTPSSQRCHLRGRCLLRAGPEALELRHPQSHELLLSWPYRFLRRFGRDKVTFSFEAGRRCSSGEGNFEFDTRQGNDIFQAIEAAIELQRGQPGRPHEEPPGDGKPPKAEGKGLKAKPPAAGEPPQAVDVPYAEPCDSLRRGAAATARAPDRLESEYAVPFDAIAKSLLARQFGGPQEPVPEPLSVPRAAGGARQPPGRPTAPKPPEHIYDEPEGLSGLSGLPGLSGLSLYDEPQEVKGHAWRLQAAPEEPPGLGCPYDAQRDDYAVPKGPFLLQGKEWLGHGDYDNVALKVARKRNLQ